VSVKSPYILAGTTTPDASVLHVKVCWDANTTFARVIGTSTVNVCGSAAARNTGIDSGTGGATGTTNDCSVEDNFATPPPAEDPTIYVFDPGGGYPDVNQTINFANGNKTAKHDEVIFALFDGHGTAIDLSSIVFTAPTTISGPNGQSVPLAMITPSDNHGPEASNAKGVGYVVQTLDGAGKVQNYVPGSTRVLISYRLPADAKLKTPTNDHFLYTADLHVNDSQNAGANPPKRCGNASWSFTHDGKITSTCTENSFFGYPPEPSNGTLIAGQAVRSYYVDESPLQAQDISTLPTFGIDFNYTGPDGVKHQILPQSQDPTGGYRVIDPSDSGHRKDKFNSTIEWTVPVTFVNADYSIYLKAYDTDGGTSGHDCGVSTWTLTVQGGTGNGQINLVE